MTIGEKMKQLMDERGLTLLDLESRLKDIFGKKALRFASLYRIEKGLRDPRVASLTQICLGLEVSLKDLKERTEEKKFSLVEIIRRRDKVAKYVYSEDAYLEILSGEEDTFFVGRLVLNPGGKTNLEQDPIELGMFRKWIRCEKGKITIIVGQEKNILGKNEVIRFKSTYPHSFENNTAQQASCIIIQNPKHI